MNTISAQDIKRRGVVALEEALLQGPVHVLKNNRPVCVVISEDEYCLLSQKTEPNNSLIDWMLSKPATGEETSESIALRIHEERGTWD